MQGRDQKVSEKVVLKCFEKLLRESKQIPFSLKDNALVFRFEAPGRKILEKLGLKKRPKEPQAVLATSSEYISESDSGSYSSDQKAEKTLPEKVVTRLAKFFVEKMPKQNKVASDVAKKTGHEGKEIAEFLDSVGYNSFRGHSKNIKKLVSLIGLKKKEFFAQFLGRKPALRGALEAARDAQPELIKYFNFVFRASPLWNKHFNVSEPGSLERLYEEVYFARGDKEKVTCFEQRLRKRLREGGPEAAALWRKMNLRSFLEVQFPAPGEPAGDSEDPGIPGLAQVLEETPEPKPLLRVLADRLKEERLRPDAPWRHLQAEIEDNGIGEPELTQYLSRNSGVFREAQHRVATALQSFELKLSLEALNAHFVDVEKQDFAPVIGEALINVEPGKLVEFLLSPLEEDMPPESSKTAQALKKAVLRTVVLGYRRLSQQDSLEAIWTALNKHAGLGFNARFWSRTLLANLLYRYADFELRCQVTKLLHAQATVPLFWLGGGLREVLVNAFLQLVLRRQVGVASFAVGSAACQRLGKSELLNEVFGTRFETNRNDAYRRLGADVDFGEGFFPARKMAVVDCNLGVDCLGGVLHVTNVALVTVTWEDLVDDFDRIETIIRGVVEHKAKVGVVLVVRDYKVYCGRVEADTDFVCRAFAAETAEEGQEDEKSAQKRAQKSLEAELDAYSSFSKKRKKRRTETKKEAQRRSDRARKEKFKATEKRLNALQKSLQNSMGADRVAVCLLKHLGKFDKPRRKKALDKIKLAVNAMTNQIEEGRGKFSKRGFRKLLKHFRELGSGAPGGSAAGPGQAERVAVRVPEEAEKVKKLYKELDLLRRLGEEVLSQKEEDVFPFNGLWKQRDQCFREIARLGVAEKQMQVELDQKIDSIEKAMLCTAPTEPLRRFKDTVTKSSHPTALLWLFEDHLHRQTREIVLDLETEQGLGSEMPSKIPLAERLEKTWAFDINLYWRNLKPFLEPGREGFDREEKRKLVALMERLFASGYGFELIDGDHFVYWGSFLRHFGDRFGPGDQFLTVSVKGPQSSGKSTLANLQFGTNFKSGAGKCTAGINGFIMRFEENFADFEDRVTRKGAGTEARGALGAPEDSDQSVGDLDMGSKFLLFLDSQGMLSEELRGQDFDRKVGTFLLAVSQVVQANFSGNLTSQFHQLLELTSYSYLRLDLGRRNLFRGEGNGDAQKLPPTQKMIFVSNKNFNLGGTDEQAKQVVTVENSVLEIATNIEQTGEALNARSLLLEHDKPLVRLLGNAFDEWEIEKDDEVGDLRQMRRFSVNKQFLKQVRGLQELTVEQFELAHRAQTPEQRRRWSIDALAEDMGQIWRQIYFNLEMHNLDSIKGKVVDHDFEQVISETMAAFVQRTGLAENFMAEAAKTALEGEGKDTGKRLKEVLGKHSLKLVKMVKQAEQTEPGEDEEDEGGTEGQAPGDNWVLGREFLKLKMEAFEMDMDRLRKYVKSQEQVLKEELREWLAKKNEEGENSIRKQKHYEENRLIRLHERKFGAVQFYEGVHGLNYFFVGHLRLLDQWGAGAKERIRAQVEQRYREFSRSHKGKYQAFMETVDGEIAEIIEEEKTHCRTVFFGNKGKELRKTTFMCLDQVFMGLFPKFRGKEGSKVWASEAFEAKARERLQNMRGKHFHVDTAAIKRLDLEPEERLREESFFNFAEKVQVEKDQFRLPPSEEKAREMLLAAIKAAGEGFFEGGMGAGNLQSMVEDLEDCGLVARAEESSAPSEVLSVEDAGRELERLKWNFKASPEHLRHWLDKKPGSALAKLLHPTRVPLETPLSPDILFEEKRVTFSAPVLSQLREGGSASLSEADFNFFFAPHKCFSVEKVKRVFERVLSKIGCAEALARETARRVDSLFQALRAKDDRRGLFDLDFTRLQRLHSEVAAPLLKALRDELADHGAELSYELEEAVVELLAQRFKGLFRNGLDSFFEAFLKEQFAWDCADIREHIRVKFIEKDIQKTNELRYREHFEVLEAKLEGKFFRKYNENVMTSLKKIAESFADKPGFIGDLEKSRFACAKVDQKHYRDLMEYFKDPRQAMTDHFNGAFEPEMAKIVNEKTRRDFATLFEKNLSDGAAYLGKLGAVLKAEGVWNDFEILIEENSRKPKREPGELEGEFRRRLLRNVIETGKFNPKYSAKLGGIKVKMKLEQSNKKFVGKGTPLMLFLTKGKVKVHELKFFVERLQQFLLDFLKKFKSDASVRERILKLSDISQFKAEIQTQLLGCTEKCPFCNRLCAKRSGHPGKHSAGAIGHGIINIHCSNSKKKTTFSKGNLLQWGQFPLMELKFCDACHEREEQKVLVGYKEKRWCEASTQGKARRWDFSENGGGRARAEEFRNICLRFWSAFGKTHCETHHYLHVESTPAPNVILFAAENLLGEIKIEKSGKKRSYLRLSEQIEGFCKDLSELHPYSKITFCTVAFAGEGKKTVLSQYKKAIRSPGQTRNKLAVQYFETDNGVPEKFSFDAFSKAMQEQTTKFPGHFGVFVFALKKLKTLSFEQLQVQAPGAQCHTVVFTKGEKTLESQLEQFFGKDKTDFVKYSQVDNLKPEILTKELWAKLT